jgi:hypothetical protein
LPTVRTAYKSAHWSAQWTAYESTDAAYRTTYWAAHKATLKSAHWTTIWTAQSGSYLVAHRIT